VLSPLVDHALQVGSGPLEVIAHEDAVEAGPLGLSGLLARLRGCPIGAGKALAPAAESVP
jgi:hypothetical protein